MDVTDCYGYPEFRLGGLARCLYVLNFLGCLGPKWILNPALAGSKRGCEPGFNATQLS